MVGFDCDAARVWACAILLLGCGDVDLDGGGSSTSQATDGDGSGGSSDGGTTGDHVDDSGDASTTSGHAGTASGSSSSSDDGGESSGSGDASGSTTTGAIWDVPDPGDDDGFCQDEEPNDSPNEAVPCGVVEPFIAPDGALYVLNGATIGDGDDADYFVFRASPELTETHTFAQWSTDQNLLDWNLYEVTGDGTTLVEIWSGASTESYVESPGMNIPVTPGAVYLVEVLSVAGAGEYLM